MPAIGAWCELMRVDGDYKPCVNILTYFFYYFLFSALFFFFPSFFYNTKSVFYTQNTLRQMGANSGTNAFMPAEVTFEVDIIVKV